MSVDLAVWEGLEPTTADEAAQTFDSLYERYIDKDNPTPPSERIASYVATLLARHPDLTELDDEKVDDSPWADGPLINNASGPFIYFAMVTNPAAEDAWSFAVSTARTMGLVCFDPQSGTVAD
jgi:hypothetical protein